MGKHNHNYTNYSKPQNFQVEPEVIETAVTNEGEVVAVFTEEVERTDVKAVVDEETVKTEEVVPAPAAPIIGMVTDCVKLNVRKEPTKDSQVLRTILLATEVVINEEESTEDFYKVYVEGLSGYCMKKFININA